MSGTPSIEIVVAAAENDVIGRDGDLPWHLPKDLRHFKRLTLGHPVLLGRRTFDSILAVRGAPRTKRRSIVLSRDAARRAELAERWEVETAADLDTALALASDAEHVFVIGGAGVYGNAMERATVLHLTRVHAEVAGDVTFPSIDAARWRLVDATPHPVDERHAHAFTIERYERR
ncbi:MAG: dihydrofolate reductase [Acidobacteriota bacterium]